MLLRVAGFCELITEEHCELFFLHESVGSKTGKIQATIRKKLLTSKTNIVRVRVAHEGRDSDEMAEAVGDPTPWGQMANSELQAVRP